MGIDILRFVALASAKESDKQREKLVEAGKLFSRRIKLVERKEVEHLPNKFKW
ncbi:MAG: hypothetical protein ACE5NG_20340 [bacterium]